MAVPSGAIAGALANVRGLQGKPTIDATNASTGRNQTQAPGVLSIRRDCPLVTHDS
jgi:hypothetical protein